MDTYADDAYEVVARLTLRMLCTSVTQRAAGKLRAMSLGTARVESLAVLISAIPPLFREDR